MSNIEKLMNTNWPDDTEKEVTIKYKKEDNCENEIKPLSRLRIIRDMQLPSGANVSVLINTENLSEQYSLYLLSVSTYTEVSSALMSPLNLGLNGIHTGTFSFIEFNLLSSGFKNITR